MKKEIILKTSKGEIPVDLDDRTGVGYVELDDDDLNKLIPTPEIPKTYLDLSMIDWDDENLHTENHLDDFVEYINEYDTSITEQDILDLFAGKIPLLKTEGGTFNVYIDETSNSSHAYACASYVSLAEGGDVISYSYYISYDKVAKVYVICEI